MPSNAMTRRRLLATGVTTTAALTLSRFVAASALLPQATGEVRTFYDPRFPSSRQLARALPGAAQLLAVHSDPSQLLARMTPDAVGVREVRWQGVTTESIPFCLEQLARRHHDARLESRRLNRDLFVWSLSIRLRSSAA
jgi:hypothetical protein